MQRFRPVPALTALALLAALPAAPAAAVPVAAEAITWAACTDERLAGAECASVEVPADHRKPAGPTLTIAISRVRASVEGADYLGPLLVNPGGPGVPGRDLPLAVAGALPAEVSARYDLIGFDARGTGASTPPLRCDPEYFREIAPDPVPTDAGEIRGQEQAWLERVDSYAGSCERGSGSRDSNALAQVRTADVARDLDLIRAALGAERISFLGFSYGTYLGQVYASAFPNRTGRFVLVGNVAPDGVGYAGDLGRPESAAAFDANAVRFFDWVARNAPFYGLGTDQQAVTARYYAGLDALRAGPVAGVGPSEWVRVFTAAVYRDAAWPLLAQGWSAWEAGRRGTFAAVVAILAETADETDQVNAARLAVSCTDGPWDRTYRQIRAQTFDTARTAPFAAWSLHWELTAPCTRWPVPAGNPAPVGDASASILFVNTEFDAPTPYADALAARGAFPRSALILEEGALQHAGGFFSGNACVDAAAHRYLLSGELPTRVPGNDADLRCARTPEPGLVEILLAAALEPLTGGVELPIAAGALPAALAELVRTTQMGVPALAR